MRTNCSCIGDVSVQGDPKAALERFCESEGIDLLVIGTRAGGKLRKTLTWVLGIAPPPLWAGYLCHVLLPPCPCCVRHREALWQATACCFMGRLGKACSMSWGASQIVCSLLAKRLGALWCLHPYLVRAAGRAALLPRKSAPCHASLPPACAHLLQRRQCVGSPHRPCTLPLPRHPLQEHGDSRRAVLVWRGGGRGPTGRVATLGLHQPRLLGSWVRGFGWGCL